MTTDIFIRTYHKDLPWLRYCLRSIAKFVTGYRQIIIMIPEQEKHLLGKWNLTREKVIGWKPVCENGYIDQQINKLMSYQYTDAEYILFVDSDVCFTRPVNVLEYFKDGKPIILKTKYESVGDAICWKEPTESLINSTLEYEYMRRLPILYKASTIQNAGDLAGLYRLSRLERLSEFNLVGAYADLHDNENYHFIDTEKEQYPPNSVKQNWSWGGLSEEIKNELEEILR